jgi:hypothetical protein
MGGAPTGISGCPVQFCTAECRLVGGVRDAPLLPQVREFLEPALSRCLDESGSEWSMK